MISAFSPLLLLLIGPQLIVGLFVNSIINLTNYRNQRNLTCYDQSTLNRSENAFQLCAIRTYNQSTNGTEGLFSIRNGFWSINGLSAWIPDHDCVGFNSNTDVGDGYCQNSTYENTRLIQICICAENECNKNVTTCISANNLTRPPKLLSTALMSFSPPINCSRTTNSSLICDERERINKTECERFIKEQSKLCVLRRNGSSITQIPLVQIDYQLYLDKMIRRAQISQRSSNHLMINETDHWIYVQYRDNTNQTIDECICRTSSLCNADFFQCAPGVFQLPVITIETVPPPGVEGEFGLGRAAIAGIACGIIFTSVIIIGEIIYFKLRPTNPRRAARYHT